MGSTAVQIITEAYRNHNLDEVTTFSTTLEFPYKIALNVLNATVREINRMGNLWFMETKTALTYSNGVNTYSFSSLSVDPKRIIRLRREATNYWGEMKQYNYRQFQQLFQMAATATAEPNAWTKFNDTLTLNTIPDQDYTLELYHFKDMPLISATSDTFLVPERDEDILIDCCYQWLGYKMGRWDIGTAIQAIKILAQPFLAQMEEDAGMPQQMPAAF